MQPACYCGSRDDEWLSASARRNPSRQCRRPATRHSSAPALGSRPTVFLLLPLQVLSSSFLFHRFSPLLPYCLRPPPSLHLSRPAHGGELGLGPGTDLGPGQTGRRGRAFLCLCASPPDRQTECCPLTSSHLLLFPLPAQALCPLHCPPLLPSLSRRSGKTSPEVGATVSVQRRDNI